MIATTSPVRQPQGDEIRQQHDRWRLEKAVLEFADILRGAFFLWNRFPCEGGHTPAALPPGILVMGAGGVGPMGSFETDPTVLMIKRRMSALGVEMDHFIGQITDTWRQTPPGFGFTCKDQASYSALMLALVQNPTSAATVCWAVVSIPEHPSAKCISPTAFT